MNPCSDYGRRCEKPSCVLSGVKTRSFQQRECVNEQVNERVNEQVNEQVNERVNV